MSRLLLALLAVLAVLAMPVVPAFAAPQKSCPPLGALPNYIPQEARTRNWDWLEFTRKTGVGDETEDVTQYGRTCQISYQLKEGADTMSNLEAQMNFRQQLTQLGAVIQSEGGRDTYAVLKKDGAETWFRTYGGDGSYELTTLQVEPPKLTLLPPSGNDYKLLGHLPDYVSAKPTVKNYDSMTFSVIENDVEKEVTAQGRTFTVNYEYKGAKDPLANPEINYNYREALKALGAEILYIGGRETTGRLLRDGQVIWFKTYAGETSVEVSAVEEKPFEAAIKPPPPAQMQTTMMQTGRVTLYVNFDFDKATLRPEAAAVVTQVVAMLKADPKLRLNIEGHTDALGTAERNRKLSADRAASFVAALAAQGIAADRLASAGFGPDKPLATNDTSDGRAKNRRVELVRM